MENHVNISSIKNPVLQRLATCLDSAIEKDSNAFSNEDFGYKKDGALNDAEYGAFVELAKYLVKEKKCSKADLEQVIELTKGKRLSPELFDKDIGDRLFGNTKEASKYTQQLIEIDSELDEYNAPSFKKTVRDFTNWWNKSTVGKHMKIEPESMKRQKELQQQKSTLNEKLKDYEMSQILNKIGFSDK